jgi:hypothetical protein
VRTTIDCRKSEITVSSAHEQLRFPHGLDRAPIAAPLNAGEKAREKSSRENPA